MEWVQKAFRFAEHGIYSDFQKEQTMGKIFYWKWGHIMLFLGS